MKELIEERTRNSKTHDLGNCKFAWDGSTSSIHYKDNPKDENEPWKNIDNIFEETVAPWNWQMLKASYHLRVKEDFTAGQIIEFEKQGETVQFQPMALEWTNDLDQIQLIFLPQNAIPTITNPETDLLPAVGMPSHQGTIRWNDAYGEGIEFEWQATPSRLIKILEIENLNNLPIPEQYILDGGNPVLRLNLIFAPSKDINIYVDGGLWDRKSKKQTFNVIEFRKDGKVLWGFMPLMYWGNNPESEQNKGQSVATLEKRGNKLYISTRVPYEWLQSAIYPVFIDVDVDEQVGANADDGTGSYGGTFYPNFLYAGNTAVVCNAFCRWPGVTISGTIDTSYIQWCGKLARASVQIRLKIYGVDEDNPAAPTTVGEYNADPETTAAVDWDLSNIAVNTWYTSGSLNTIFQELVDSYTISNEAVMVKVKDDGSPSSSDFFQGYDYNDDTTKAAKLHIEYTVGGAVYNMTCSDILDKVDSLIAQLTIGCSCSDVMDGVDSQLANAIFIRNSSDIISLVDNVAAFREFLSTVTDIMDGVDTNSITLTFARSASDTLEGVDSNISKIIFTRTAADILEGVDMPSISLTITLSVSDIAEMVDSSNVFLATLNTCLDTLEGVDTTNIQITFAGTAIDIMEQSDSGTVQATLTITAEDVLSGVESVNSNLEVIRNALDVLAAVDSDLAKVIFATSAIDIAEVTDSGTVSIITTLSSSDIMKLVDSTTAGEVGEIILSCLDILEHYDTSSIHLEWGLSAIDILKHTDSGTANIQFILNTQDILAGTDSIQGNLIFLRSALDIIEVSDLPLWGKIPKTIFKTQEKALVMTVQGKKLVFTVQKSEEVFKAQ